MASSGSRMGTPIPSSGATAVSTRRTADGIAHPGGHPDVVLEYSPARHRLAHEVEPDDGGSDHVGRELRGPPRCHPGVDRMTRGSRTPSATIVAGP